MKTYSEKSSLICAQDIAIFRMIEQLIDKFDDSNLKLSQNEDGSPRDLSCHMLTQALARMSMCEELRACSGYYLPGYEHSWLVSKHGYSIIDPYPWACLGGAILVDRRVAHARIEPNRSGGFSGIYLENSEVLSGVITRNVNFWSDVAKVQASLEQVSANL